MDTTNLKYYINLISPALNMFGSLFVLGYALIHQGPVLWYGVLPMVVGTVFAWIRCRRKRLDPVEAQ
jgi:hypothetical protein